MKVNAQEESFELMEMLGQRVLFTNMRVDRDTVPQDLYVYEVRHDDDCMKCYTERAVDKHPKIW